MQERKGYQTMYWQVSVKKIMDIINVSGESKGKGDQCATEKIKSSPHTITPPCHPYILVFNTGQYLPPLMPVVHCLWALSLLQVCTVCQVDQSKSYSYAINSVESHACTAQHLCYPWFTAGSTLALSLAACGLTTDSDHHIALPDPFHHCLWFPP